VPTASISIRKQLPPRGIEIDIFKKYEIEKILDLRQRHGKLQYFTHWPGYNINEQT